MKLIRFGDPGREKPGLQLEDGARVDASAFGSDYDEAFLRRRRSLAPARMGGAKRGACPAGGAGCPAGTARSPASKIVCIGLNYPITPRRPARRSRRSRHLLQGTSSLVGPDDDLVTLAARRRWTGRSSWQS